MALANSTWREHPFEQGCTYIAKRSFDARPSGHFVAGEKYALVGISHSHYDGCSIFRFQEAGSSHELSWWWPDDDSVAECLARFERTSNDDA